VCRPVALAARPPRPASCSATLSPAPSPPPPRYDDAGDDELLKLLPFLEGLVDVDDVRPSIAAKFRLKELVARTAL
jgi:hypothetical protein